MRLIDADVINFNQAFGGNSEFAKDMRDAAQGLIDRQPTAFDKEKVIDDLENLKNNLIDCNDLCGECVEIECDQCALKKAIEIVEKGGKGGIE